jgi:hypothetical protein
MPETPILLSSMLVLASLLFLCAPARGQITTSQYNNARTGANLDEAVLTPQNVNARQFGKLFSLNVDGDVYTQPLYLSGVDIPRNGQHNVIFVATEHDSVYALDADAYSATPLWQVSFIRPEKGVTTLSADNVQCPFISPEVGITSTPVIDAVSGTLYVLVRTRETTGSHVQFVQRLHALAVTTGAEKFGGPVTIQASVKTTSLRILHTQEDFDPLRENPRAALLLADGKVYLTWASSCDVGPYHGWMMAYDAHTLAQTGVFNTSPDADQSGIWAGDTGPAADASGNIYVATGNGKFDAADSGGRDYGDSLLKLGLTGASLSVRDYFTPFNQAKLNDQDNDLGSGGPVLLPDQPGAHPHLLLVAGKGGLIYVLDRDHLGGAQVGSDRLAVQTVPCSDGAFGAPAYWNGHVFFACAGDVIKDFALRDGRLSPQPVAQGGGKFADGGATPTVSSNGARDGIVWALNSKAWNENSARAVLHAYDAANVAHELYNSNENNGRDALGLCLRFNTPTVVNGKVYVGTKKELSTYGLLTPPPAKPVRKGK